MVRKGCVKSMLVLKRNGTKVPFDKQKIVNAIMKAMKTEDVENNELALKIADSIEKIDNELITVDEIEDIVEKKLMSSSYKDVAKTYIKVRQLKNMAESQYRELMYSVAEKIEASNVVNQNANVDEKSFGGRIGEASNVLQKQYALEYIVSEKSKQNHLNNEIYIHDLDWYTVGNHNCLTIPFDHLLANGFNTRQTDVRPAQSVSTAFQLVAVLFQLQSLQQFGGVAASHLDHTMVPYVRKSFYKHFKEVYEIIKDKEWDKEFDPVNYSIEDEIYKKSCKGFFGRWKSWRIYKNARKLTQKEILQSVEGMYHNLNTLQSRSGCQLPFTSINYGTCTLVEGRLITEALLKISYKGIGKHHKTSIFPCGIFQLMKGVNRQKGDPNYDLFRLALKSTAKRLYPNYANCDWSGNEGYDKNRPDTYFATMGCRTANGFDINGLGQQKDGRGNICPVTIILPTLAMQAKEAIEINGEDIDLIDGFMVLLDKKIHEAKDMLIERFDWICSQSPDSAKFMYENGLMAGYIPEEGIRSALKHGTLAVGQLGLAECLQILIGCDHTTEAGMQLAIKIESLFQKRCAEFKKEYSLNFGVYYTPAENMCHTAMKKFKARYGVIENVSDKEFFTNSMHVPVWKHMSPFEKIDIESKLTGFSSAGCITYVELDHDCLDNIDGLESIVNYAMEKDIPYFAINVPVDFCNNCGYEHEIPVNENCPKCNSSDVSHLRRVTGYLTGNFQTAFNKGKQEEVLMRVKHK